MYEAVECHEYLELPALTIGVDGDGAGRTVILDLEEMGIPVECIHWGLPAIVMPRRTATSTCAPTPTAKCAKPFLPGGSRGHR